ncbi:MAG: lipooligosaccharide transport system permease protein [Actinomycetota bacterium]|nr:lipooligosaccharide transport system permease protein [Actinomycetota bacterium]
MSTPPAFRVVEREALVFARLWRGIAFSTFVAPALFLGAMGVGLGGLVKAHTGAVDGLSYLDFVAPGLLVASSMQLAASESMWPVLGGVKWMRQFHGVVATPIGPGQLYGGFVLWTALRSMIGAAAFLLVAALLGAVPSVWGILAVPAAGLCAAAFCALLAAYSVGVDSDMSFPMIMRLGVLPLFLFSGTFFPVSQLPHALRPLAVFSPLWHGVELGRDATTGNFDAAPVLAHVAVLAGCIAVGAVLGVRAFTRRLSS